MLVGLLVAMAATGSARADGAPTCKPVSLTQGGPARTVHGRVSKVSDRFDYCFRGRSGETLDVQFRGPAARLVLFSPNGDANGPGPSRNT